MKYSIEYEVQYWVWSTVLSMKYSTEYEVQYWVWSTVLSMVWYGMVWPRRWHSGGQGSLAAMAHTYHQAWGGGNAISALQVELERIGSLGFQWFKEFNCIQRLLRKYYFRKSTLHLEILRICGGWNIEIRSWTSSCYWNLHLHVSVTKTSGWTKHLIKIVSHCLTTLLLHPFLMRY